MHLYSTDAIVLVSGICEEFSARCLGRETKQCLAGGKLAYDAHSAGKRAAAQKLPQGHKARIAARGAKTSYRK